MILAILKKIKKGFYQDSLKLMRVSEEIKSLPGVEQAFAFMATEINKQTRIQDSLLDDEVRLAEADDLVLLVECDDVLDGSSFLDEFEKRIVSNSVQESDDGHNKSTLSTLEQGKSKVDANIAVISVPGSYATVQALIALNQNMNVMLFSDNVSIEDEIMLKDYAISRNLIVMGPDCGTAIINGVPLCFANVVRRGNIGIIGASGTGLQELTVQLDLEGYGITHAIGTGGRDLTSAVAGRTTLFALNLLEKDDNTEMIAIISKPPAPEVAKRVTDAVINTGKPAVLAFLGAESTKINERVFIAGTIEEATSKIIALSNGEDPTDCKVVHSRKNIDSNLYYGLNQKQRKIKGLYTGGTLASEAKIVLKDLSVDIIDLGDDEFTRGRLHPMIDPSIRNEFMLKAYNDEEVAVILCDVVLGYGSHHDPAGELAESVEISRIHSSSNKVVIASVTGTENDPQIREQQIKRLIKAGIHVFPTNQYAAEMAAKIVNRQGVDYS